MSVARENRKHPRLPVDVIGANPVLVTAGVLPRAAILNDISVRGLGLLATFAPAVGSVIPVWLPGPPGEPSSLVLAEVIYTNTTDEGLIAIGLSCTDESGARAVADLQTRLAPKG